MPAMNDAPLPWGGPYGRITNYERELKRPSYLACQADWTFGMWLIGNSYKKRTTLYGAFQGDILKRIATLHPDRERVLHLFAGDVDLSVMPGDTLDIRPETNPTYCCNAETCEGVDLSVYDLVVGDPPYSDSDANRYGQCLVNRNKVMATLGERLSPGAFVVWLDQVLPMYRKDQLKIECVVGIVGSTNHRFRVLTWFRRVSNGCVQREGRS
jgi:hypothetical protein